MAKAHPSWPGAEVVRCRRYRSWATNPIVQLGAVRPLTNPAITKGVVNSVSVMKAVSDATAHVNHQFWPLNEPVREVSNGAEAHLAGYRQWTDLFLLRHAMGKKGKPVTFDSSLAELADDAAREHILVLK